VRRLRSAQVGIRIEAQRIIDAPSEPPRRHNRHDAAPRAMPPLPCTGIVGIFLIPLAPDQR
jgi:hypothetical protein